MKKSLIDRTACGSKCNDIMTSTFAHISPKHIFGFNQSCKSINAYFVDKDKIIYPSGCTAVILNLETKSQTFLDDGKVHFQCESKKAISSLTVSKNLKYAAVAYISDKPQIIVYDLTSLKEEARTHFITKPFISLSFAGYNNKYVGALSEAPHQFFLWKWDVNDSIVKPTLLVGVDELGPIYEISSPPDGSSPVFSFVGYECFHCVKYDAFQPYPTGKSHHFLCHTWYNKDLVIAGTTSGTLMLYDKGEYCHNIPINVKSEILLKKKLSMNAQYNYTGTEVTAIATYSMGFVVAYGIGNVIVFKDRRVSDWKHKIHSLSKRDDDFCKQLYVIKIPHGSSEPEDRIVRAISVSPNNETIVATTLNGNVYSYKMHSSAEVKFEENIFELVSSSFGTITRLDCSIRNNLIITCGTDKVLRIWNINSMEQVATKEFSEELYSVAVHPSGLFILVGFGCKIRMYSVLKNDISFLNSWPIGMCKEMRFSNQGNLFAVANNHTLHLFKTLSLEHVKSMAKHKSEIKRITWTNDDTTVVSAGETTIYEWDIISGKADEMEIGDLIVSAVVTPNNKTHFAISMDGFLKEVQVYEEIIFKELPLGLTPTCITLGNSGKIVLVGFNEGTVRAFTYAGTTGMAEEWTDYKIHSAAITGIICTIDATHCVSAAEDNSLCVWKMTTHSNQLIQCPQVKPIPTDADKAKLTTTKVVRRTVDAIELLSAEKNASNLKLIAALQPNVTPPRITMDSCLTTELGQYNSLKSLMDKPTNKYENRLINRQYTIDELIEYFEQIIEKNFISSNSNRIDAVAEANMEQQVEEILEMTFSYENRTEPVKPEMKVALKGQTALISTSTTNNNLSETIQEEGEENVDILQNQDHIIEGILALVEFAKNKIQLNSEGAAASENALAEKEAIIANQDELIVNLMKKNRDLEKFKRLLNGKNLELKEFIKPKENEILSLQQRNAEMETTLEFISSNRELLQQKVSELENQLTTIRQSERNSDRRNSLKRSFVPTKVRSYCTRAIDLISDHRTLKRVAVHAPRQVTHTFNWKIEDFPVLQVGMKLVNDTLSADWLFGLKIKSYRQNSSLFSQTEPYIDLSCKVRKSGLPVNYTITAKILDKNTHPHISQIKYARLGKHQRCTWKKFMRFYDILVNRKSMLSKDALSVTFDVTYAESIPI